MTEYNRVRFWRDRLVFCFHQLLTAAYIQYWRDPILDRVMTLTSQRVDVFADTDTYPESGAWCRCKQQALRSIDRKLALWRLLLKN